MEHEPRSIDSCGYRAEIREESGIESARCGLLATLAGSSGLEACRVRRDACLACCRARLPSAGRLNPVIASMLYPIAETLAACGTDARRAAVLRRWAERSLEAEVPADAIPPWPRRAVVPCGYLGEPLEIDAHDRGCETGPGPGPEVVFACRHPSHGRTTESKCRGCREWMEVPGPPPPSLERIVPPPSVRRGPGIRNWAVGVTTAPRRQATLEWTLDSLYRAGWDTPRLFVDSATAIADRFAHLPVTLREPAVGAWPNFYLGLAELLMREPEADAYLMVQDDLILYDREDLRAYLERTLWPAEPIGAVSLYCPTIYTQPQPGWHRHEGEWVYGALAFLFPRESAQRLIADLRVLEHRWSRWNGGKANIDVVIGRWAVRHKRPVYYPTPSLVQHIGDTSTIWRGARALGVRKAGRFAGDLA